MAFYEQSVEISNLDLNWKKVHIELINQWETNMRNLGLTKRNMIDIENLKPSLLLAIQYNTALDTNIIVIFNRYITATL